MTSPLVEVRSVSAGYGASEALRDVDLAVEPGQLCAVLGPNGAGKSTLVKVLSGLLAPRRGKVTVGGEDLAGLDRRAVARLVAVVPQVAPPAPGFTVHEVVTMGRAPHQGSWMTASPRDLEAVARALSVCELTDLAPRMVAELSGGEQKRVSIARALAQETPLLLLDEAGAHLDVRHSGMVHEVVREELSRRPMACIAVLHDLNAAAQYADRVVLLKAGRIMAQGLIEEVMTYRKLKEAFDTELYVGVNELDNARYFLPVRPRPSTKG